MSAEGIGYTLATGRLFCPVGEFHEWAEKLMGRPIFTHEFASLSLWEAMRSAFEAQVLAGTTDGVFEARQ